MQKELAEKDTEIIEMKKEIIDQKAKLAATAKVDTNLAEARRLAALDAEKKKAEEEAKAAKQAKTVAAAATKAADPVPSEPKKD